MLGIIIVEYNPLHNGHIYHIEQTKKLMQKLSPNEDNNLVAIMSGNFTERGDIAILNKYTRAKHAILAGVDMVIELPSIYATSSAEFFANGAMQIAKKIKNASLLCFGAENDDIELLKKIADITTFDEYNNLVKEAVKTGLSYPASCTKALQHFANINPEVLAMPNNILAIEYIKQAHKLGLFNLQMQAIKRQGNDYNDENLSQTFSSAKAIRIALSQKNINPKNLQIPQYVEQDLQNSAIDYNKYLALIASKAIELNEVYEDNEGILNRIKKYALQANSYDELVDLAHTKRYTKSKIKRIMAHIVLSHKASDLKPIGKPQVLAIKKDKKHLLSCIDFSGNDDLINIDKYSNKIYNIISKDKITNEKMLIIE